jgi:uncharacterized integral membrane protein (TIGR00698 family)
MNSPSNPRELAYKRNYRWLFFLLVVVANVPANAAFTSTTISVPKTSPRGSRLAPVPPQQEHSKKKLDTTIVLATLQDTTTSRNRFRNNVVLDHPIIHFCAERSPGVLLSVALAQLSIAIGKTSLGTHVSPLLWATILGMAYGNILHKRYPTAKQALAKGIKFSKGRLLRLGIILYGFKITLQQIAGIGMAGLMTDLVMVSSTLSLGILLGTKWLGLDRATSTLIGSGAAICGCSAVLATQPVVGGESHQVSAAVGTVVLGGTLSMFLYPFLYKLVPFLAHSPKLMGIYTGSTIHEIAGVVAAGNAMGSDVAFTAVVTKLARVLLLAPVLTGLSWMQNRKCVQEEQQGTKRTSTPTNCKLVLPWFAFGFVAISALHSCMHFPAGLVRLASKTSAFSLLAAMAALGVDSDFYEIRKLGSKPLILAATLWCWLAIGGLGVAKFFVGVM